MVTVKEIGDGAVIPLQPRRVIDACSHHDASTIRFSIQFRRPLPVGRPPCTESTNGRCTFEINPALHYNAQVLNHNASDSGRKEVSKHETK